MYSVCEFEPSAQGYEALAALHRVISPDGRQETAAGLEKEDADWPRDKLFKRFIATEDCGEYIAEGVCFEAYWQYRAGSVHLHFSIDPGHATERVLAALYSALLAYLDRRGERVDRLSCGASEEDEARIRFFRHEGFREEMRWPTSELRLAEVNAAGHAQYLDQIARAGIRILTLRQVKAEVSSWKRKLRDLRYELLLDVPAPDPPTKPTVAEFEELILQDPALVEEGFFVALAEDGSFVGMCNLWRNDETGRNLDTGLTGVVRSYRRRKLGTSLKLHSVRFAQSAGAETIRARNEEDSPMYALNRKLGFRPKPAWISLQKRLSRQTMVKETIQMGAQNTQAAQLTESLNLSMPPVGLAFVDETPDGVPAYEGLAPAGCSFWQEAASRVFSTSAGDHELCSIGVHTHNLVGASDSQPSELQSALEAMQGLDYVRAEEVAAIPVVEQAVRHAVYGPLASIPVAADVVLLFAHAQQSLILTEAAARVDEGVPPAMGRPACAVVPQVTNGGHAAMSLGCCGARAYLDALSDEIALWALPGAKLEAYCAEISGLARSNEILTVFHERRRQDVAGGGRPTVQESLERLSA